MIEDSTIRQVHDRIDIVDVVSRFNITLTRKGAHYIGLCPFHNEKTGSFIVSPSRNTYHCFGCGAHGDGIDFVMKLDNRTYPEAIEYLANMYGIQILHSEKPMTDEQRDAARHRESLFVAVSRVQEYFVEQLAADTPETERARQYAYNRWGEDYCKEVGIGYCPAGWDSMPDYCRNNCLDEHALQEVGVLRFSEKSKKFYTIFRERVTIPITDKFGRIIGFTARYIGDEPDAPKYINSSDSPLFKKGDVVFGLRNAQRQASKAGRFVIVEGAPDVLKLQSDAVGLTETVATLGTAWNEAQFKQLQRYAPSLVFLPDADPPKDGEHFGAGVKAVMRNGLTALRMGFDVSVREIPFEEEFVYGPITDEELEAAKAELLEQKRDEAKKAGVRPKDRAALELTEDEIEAIPRQKIVEVILKKNDPDSFITGPDIFNTLEDVHFAVWYGLKLLGTCLTESDHVKALNEICRDVLVHISDETMLNRCLEPLAKAYGKLKLWRDALQRSQGEVRREKERKAKESMSAEQSAMRELGIIVKNGCYCSYDKEGDLERWSNFTMQPLFHIIDGDNAIRIFRLKNERGTIKELELRQEELVSLNRFKQRVESLGFFSFKGDAVKLDNLKEYLYSITDSAVQLSKMGWNTSEELYAFGDGIFADNVLYEVNDLGIVKIDERTFYLPAFSKMHLDQRDAYQFERSFSCREHGEVTLYEYVRRMVQVFGDNAKVGFAFVLATLFLDVVKQTSKRLALLNIFGRKGTGKTELGTALMSFFVRLNDPPSLATTSMASLNEMLSCAENNLVHLDEYKNELDFRKIELLKQIWGGSGQTKKNMDGDKKVQRTFVRSGVILTGQDAPTRDDALFSRVIHLAYSEVTFSKEAKRNFEEFQAISARGAVHLTVQLLKLRKLFETDYAAHYAVCKRQLMAALSEDNIEDRLLNNWLAPLAAFHTVQTSLELPFEYTDLFNICVGGIRRQNEQLKKNSDIAVFWSMLDSNHMQGRIVAKAHFAIKQMSQFKRNNGETIDFGRDKTILFLNYQNVVNALGQRVNGSNVIGKLDTVSLESYLRTHPAFLGTRQHRFQVLLPNGTPDYTFENRDGKSIRRVKEVRPMAFVFDYELLKESYEINLETVERAENELTEDDLEPDSKASSAQETAPEPHQPGIFDNDREDDGEMPF
ncbi:DNA primase [Duncaniella muris]|uniref:DNA primase n=1 Tax=Duncaniella muris TaxID=2094150 RepID=UPI0026EABA82|nr:DNA primase [Duncaniella muris]